MLNQTTPRSQVNTVTLARLVANKSRLVGKENTYFSDLYTYIAATATEINQGSEIADKMLSQIDNTLEAKKQALLSTKLSNDYVLGAHFGDGSLYVSLTWKPSDESDEVNRLRCEPEWAISGDNEVYCQAFVNTFNGVTRSVDGKDHRKFVLSGLEKCLNILSLFENAPWMPCYKVEQFSRWKEALLWPTAKSTRPFHRRRN